MDERANKQSGGQATDLSTEQANDPAGEQVSDPLREAVLPMQEIIERNDRTN